MAAKQVADIQSQSRRWGCRSPATAGLRLALVARLLAAAAISIIALITVSCSSSDRDDESVASREQTKPAVEQRGNADEARLPLEELIKQVPDEHEQGRGNLDETNEHGRAIVPDIASTEEEPPADPRTPARAMSARRAAAVASVDQFDPWQRYVKLVNLADGAVDSGDYSEARKLLNSCPTEHRGWEWDYLMGQTKEGVISVRKVGADNRGTDSIVQAGLRFSSDGQKLAVLNTAHLQVIDVAKTMPGDDVILDDSSFFEKDRRYWFDKSDNGVIAFSSDLKRLAVMDNETVVVWDLTTGKQLSRHSPDISRRINKLLAFADDGSLFVITTGFSDPKVRGKYGRPLLWEGLTGEIRRELEDWSVAIDPNARLIACQKTVLELASGNNVPAGAIEGPRGLKAGRFSSNGRWLFRHIVNREKQDFFDVCDLETGKTNELAPGTGPLDVSPEGDRLLTRNGIWDVAHQQLILPLSGGTAGRWSPDGRRIAVAEYDGWQIMYAPENVGLLPDKPDAPLVPRRTTIRLYGRSRSQFLAFSPDGTRIAAASDGTLKQWDAATGQPMMTFTGHIRPDLDGPGAAISNFAFSPDGTRIASAGHIVQLWDAATGQQIRTIQRQNISFSSVTFSPDGMRIAAGASNNEVMVWDVTTGKQLQTLKGHKDQVESVAFSPNGKLIASGSLDKTVTLWDAATGRATRTLREFAGRVFNVAFTPDGTQIATSVDGEIKLWDVSTGKGGLTFEGWNRFSFSPNGKQIAAGTSNSKVKIWDAATGKELLTLTGDTSAILCVAFSPDGEQIAAASWYKFVIVVWDLDTIAPADSLEAPKAP